MTLGPTLGELPYFDEDRLVGRSEEGFVHEINLILDGPKQKSEAVKYDISYLNMKRIVYFDDTWYFPHNHNLYRKSFNLMDNYLRIFIQNNIITLFTNLMEYLNGQVTIKIHYIENEPF